MLLQLLRRERKCRNYLLSLNYVYWLAMEAFCYNEVLLQSNTQSIYVLSFVNMSVSNSKYTYDQQYTDHILSNYLLTVSR